MRLLSLASVLSASLAAELNELNILSATEDTPVKITVDYCDWTVRDKDDSADLFVTNTRCYCVTHDGTDYGCNVPGPVIQFTAGTTGVVDFTNDLVGWNTQEIEDAGIMENEFRGMEVTNLHTHGIHVSPYEDDVLIAIEPNGGRRIYNYTMPSDHYFGTHWYHAHHHGSTNLHVMNGMVGGLEVVGPDMSTLDDYNPTWLIFHYYYAVSTSDCNSCSGNDWQGFRGNDEEWGADSHCYLYCRYNADERSNSDFTYDTTTSNSDTEYFLVNGQHMPTVTISRNSYTWLRLVNGMGMYYAQLKFPDECDVSLAGNDGVFFEEFRDMSDSTYNRETVMNPGSRADVFIKCSTANTYSVEWSQGVDVDADARITAGVVAFYIEVTSAEGDQSSLPTIPDRPSYLDDLQDGSTIMTDDNTDFEQYCPCTENTNDEWECMCGVEFDFEGGTGFVNGIPFDHTTPLYLVRSGAVYEFLLDNDDHPYHQHINHFQILADQANGFVAQAGDWRDTLGGGDETMIRMRFVDFTGKVVMHCHFLPHEDLGMMAYYVIIDRDDPDTDTYPLIDTCGLVLGEVNDTSVPEDSSDYCPSAAYSVNHPSVLLFCMVFGVLVSFMI